MKKGNQAFEPWLLAGLSPTPGLTFYHGDVADEHVVILEISAASHSPVLWHGVAFIRIGSHKQKLNDHPAHAQQLYRNLDHVPFEHRACRSGLTPEDALEKIDVGAYFRLQGLSVPIDNSVALEHLVSDHLLAVESTGRYSVTNLGALLFATKMSEFPTLARKAPRVVKYKGNNKLNAEREDVGVFGYAAGFERLVTYIGTLLPANEVIGKALRAETSMFPPVAIREIVANALVHQDFSMAGAGPMIELFDNRMEVTNPGSPLIDPARFVDAAPRSRNEKLAYMMRRCRICEERGSGWDRVAAEIELHQLPAPLIRVDEGQTTVTMFAHREPRSMDREERIRAVYLHACLRAVSGERTTNSSVRERFGLSDKESSTASSYIRETLDAGLIAPHDPNAGRKHMQYVPAWAKGSTPL